MTLPLVVDGAFHVTTMALDSTLFAATFRGGGGGNGSVLSVIVTLEYPNESLSEYTCPAPLRALMCTETSEPGGRCSISFTCGLRTGVISCSTGESLLAYVAMSMDLSLARPTFLTGGEVTHPLDACVGFGVCVCMYV